MVFGPLLALTTRMYGSVTYENMVAIQPSKAKYDAVQAEWDKRNGDEDEVIDKISKGYEEIRAMGDSQIINKVIFK